MYSQHSEEQVLLRKLPAIGRFLDIGAWWPRELSNTRALYERGWSGLMVEPSPGPMQKLLQEYGYDERVALLQALVGTERGIYPMEITDEAVSTTCEEVRSLWSEQGNYYGRCFIPQITIRDLINQFGAFDFVDIDVEGGSVAVMVDLLNTPMNPFCICVEHDSKIVETERIASKFGYQTVHTNETNLIFTR